ncbi:TspO/MBR family protein [Chloroflexota bacterium]
MKDIVRQAVNTLGTIAVIAVNGMASASGLNGQLTGEISDRFDVYFVPAGYVFSIWGLIYLALIGFTVYQALPSQRESASLRRIGYLYALSCLANVAWLILWHYEYFELTVVAMLSLLGLLIAIYLRLNIGRTRVSTAERWLVHVPFSLYLGWITVATIANVTSALSYLNWTGWGISPEIWAVIMLLAAAVIASAVCITRGDAAYGLVVVWAFAGIAVKHSATVVALTAWVLAAVVLLALLMGWSRRKQRLPPLEPSTF